MLYSSRFSAILDACVLYPAPIRDILLCMAEQGLYRPKWSALIQKEWKRNLLKSRPDLKKIRLDRTSELMNNAFPDAEVQHFENLIQNLELPDPNDHHVLAAAIRGGCDSIVTFNLRDFPEANLQSYDIEAIHPDQFIMNLINLDEEEALTAFLQQVDQLNNPPKKAQEVLDTLQHNGLYKTVNRLIQIIEEQKKSKKE